MATGFRIDPLQIAPAVRPAEIDWAPIARLGDTIAAYRTQQGIGGILAQATDDKGNLDFGKAGAQLAQAGLLDQARPLLMLAEARANRARTEGHQAETLAETKRHNLTVEGIASKRAENQLTLRYEGELDDPTTKALAEQYRAGDMSVLTGLAKDPRNIIKVRKEIARQNDEFGITPAEQALRNAEFMGEKAGQRTLGNRTAQIDLAATEFKRVLPIVTDASNAVDRTNYPSLNKIIQMYREGTGDPNIVKFASGVNTLVNLYARAISPTGVGTVEQRQEARKNLDKAWSQGQFDAATGIMMQEIDAALEAPKDVRQHMRERFIGGQAGPKQAPAATTPPAAPAAPAAPAIPKVRNSADVNARIKEAREALASGAPRDRVLQRLIEMDVPRDMAERALQ